MAGLKVLILGPYPENPDKIVGGVEAVNFALTAALAAHPGVEKIVVAVFRRGAARRPVVTVGPKLEVRYLRVPFLSGDTVIRSRQCVQAVRPLVREFGPDVVHAQGIDRQADIALQLGLPMVVTVHGLVHVEARLAAKGVQGWLKVLLFEMMVRRVLRDAHTVVSISEYDARLLDGMVGQRRVSISNPIGKEFFAEASEPPAAPTVLFAGVMRPRKNVLGLVNAFAQVRARVPAARLVIAGPAPEQEYADKVRGRVAELGLGEAVSFLGHVSNEQLLQAIHGCSTLALFSNEETSPTIIAQALAVGRPVVASNVGGIAEMVTPGETGYMVPAGDEAALAEKLAAVLADPAAARAMGQRGRAFARQRYEPASVAEQTVRVYREAIGVPQAASVSAAAD